MDQRIVLMMQTFLFRNFQLAKVLGDAVLIREWNIFGLPSDALSVESAIIIK